MLPIYFVDKNVGDRLTARRTAIGMSSKTLAVELGVMTEQIEIWEAGQARIPPSLLLGIAEILGTNASYFFKTPHSVEGSGEIEQRGNASSKSDGAQAPNSQDRLLLQAFRKIKEQSRRDAVVQFAERLAVTDIGEQS